MTVPTNVASFYAESRWGNRFAQMGPYYGELGHRGLDIAASGGQDIPALRAGYVSLVRRSSVVGNTVSIESAPGDFSAYCHLAGIRVTAGEYVEQGQIIAQAASTQAVAGTAWSGPHLHTTRGPDQLAAFGPWGVTDPAPLIRAVLGGASGGDGAPGGGSGGIQVSVAQGTILQKVAQRGNYTGPIDGAMGTNSWKGVQTVITAQGFYTGPVDGFPGTNTWKGVQKLAQLGGYGGPVDGYPGDYTYQGLEAWLNEPDTGSAPPPQGIQGVYGVDVATSQRNLDFQALKNAGYQYAIVKAGGSNVVPTYVAPHYTAEVGRARAAGLLVGHYWMVGSNSPAADAAFFLGNLYDYRSGDLLALDNEAINSGRLWTDAEAATFMRAVKSKLGYVPFMYINRADLSQSSWTEVRALNAKLWIAAPDGVPGSVNISAFSEWAIHQYSWTGNQNGIEIDLNVAKISAFAGLTPPPNGETSPPSNAIPGTGTSPGTGTVSLTADQGKILQNLAKRGGYAGAVDGIPGVNTWLGVQTVLSDSDYYSGPIDGVPGSNTYKGLQLLAREGDYSGPIDGVPGSNTFIGLQNYLNNTSAGAPDNNEGIILQRIAKAGGYTGGIDGVPGANTWKGVQQVLAGYGYRGPVDGAMGTNSWAAVQRFAMKGGYSGSIDGAMGTNSWKGVQTILSNFGYTGPIDGAPGTNTYAALQRIARLGGYRGPADGMMGTNSWKGLQTFLYGSGYTGPMDGVPGANTYMALQSMASYGGYSGPIDGILGVNTYGGLQELLA
ncbi:peptidase M23 [Cryobacterium melibiosiphilum]|uniref:Peptidase M23 n=1 Tax=Cryobacterium melibiosiphilum TaxID=995039 RepID=A0A3A5MRC5_9MICO|nr:GH25 family lysozyme [Cryobacterium melibiosiphilum]RJT91525.1 peptidase M23 [Cryobacterium melibiosiphilum]